MGNQYKSISGILDDIEFARLNFELVEIKERLDKSVQDAEKEIQKRRSGLQPTDSIQKKNSAPAVEHAVISEWAKNGRWQATPFTVSSGGDSFATDLDHVM